jgi:hypothetical protein
VRPSPRFGAALRKSHTVYEYVDIVTNSHQTIKLHITTGQITVDRSAQFRRSASFTCFDPTGQLVPADAKAALSPTGTIIKPYRGILYPDGTSEVYPMGVFGLSNVDIIEASPTNGTRVTINISAYDRSRTISRQKFLQTYTIPAGTLITTAFQQLVYRTFPNAVFDIITSQKTTPYVLTYAVGDDPWQACQDLAISVGCQAFFDPDGTAVLCPPADVNALGSPDWDYIEGQGCTMTDVEAIYSDDPGYNGVIVIGASPATGAAPVMGVAWDTDPDSATYYLGPYGQVPQIVNDSNITDVTSANNSASSLLNGQLGFITQTDITCWVNPAIDVDDVVQVERQNVKATGLYVVDSLTVPLGSSTTGSPASATTQSVTLRQKRS